ncbi:hypothetical protein [Halobacterium hubeiense]|uniref:hypothetical protein n=1 Tax=Halobacterium hubeiense TaxID=1407499 RepID=UPI003C74C99B
MKDLESVSQLKPILTEAAGEIYAARQQFFHENFDGYVEDTYLVRGEGFYCWPLEEDGVFQGYTDATPQEQSVMDELVQAGFDTIGVGRSRIAMTPPMASDLVVKFGRCGFTEHYGNGRVDNLIEYCISKIDDELPILPSFHCSVNGAYAVYPKATPVANNQSSRIESISTEIKRKMADVVPIIDGQELASKDNLCKWHGRYRTLDYSSIMNRQQPVGVPSHIDSEDIIEQVNQQRQAGEKRDLVPGGGYASTSAQ